MKNLVRSESAVSESIGFLLTLSIVMLASGMVYSSGLPLLQDSMKGTHLKEMEESFTLLSQNINEVAYDRGPIRTTEMKILDGALGIVHDSTMQIIITGADNGTYGYNLGSLEYYLEGRTIAYENGGIWVDYGDNNTVMKSKPLFNYGNVTTIPVVELLNTYSKGGEGTARVQVKRSDSSSTNFFNASGNETTIIIKSNYYRSWSSYLEDDLGAHDVVIDDAARTVSANLTAQYIYVDISRLEMEIY